MDLCKVGRAKAKGRAKLFHYFRLRLLDFHKINMKLSAQFITNLKDFESHNLLLLIVFRSTSTESNLVARQRRADIEC